MTNLEKFRKLLAELFQMDRADLDFGIYRIMNQKRDEITRFLETELLPQVQEVLAEYQTGDRQQVALELAKAIEAVQKLGMNPEDSPVVQQAKAKLAELPDLAAIEQDVFKHLHNFFRRYYQDGDFISQRRYKVGVYAIPYEGEEVKLYWANHDQYYIKTTQHFRDYSFTDKDGQDVERRVHFKVAEADTEKDNIKEQAGKERKFILCATKPTAIEDGELVIRFEFRPDAEGRKQDELIKQACQIVLAEDLNEWQAILTTLAPTPANPARTLLEKHLAAYTARNTADFFIHKDLGGFLRHELDFYIKNEVMYLDDIEDQDAPKVELYLAKLKAIRRIAHKIIAFLAQLEDFQKKLWLKKKFVVETQYVVTLDRLPEELRAEALANAAQLAEWRALGMLPEGDAAAGAQVAAGQLMLPGAPAEAVLPGLPGWATLYLPVDTKHFTPEFKRKLISSLNHLDETMDGLLIYSENFQALNLLDKRYSEQLDCVYIDPPYNTAATPILYKNEYKHSCWLALMLSRLGQTRFLTKPGVHSICIAIDDTELASLSTMLEREFGDYDLHKVIVNHYPGSGTGRSNVTRTHEYALFLVPKDKDILRGEVSANGMRERGFRRSGTGENNYRIGRPNSFFAVLVDKIAKTIMGFEPPPPLGSDYPKGTTNEGWVRVYPIGEKNSERAWSLSYEKAIIAWKQGLLKCTNNLVINRLYYDDERRNLLPSVWIDKKFNAVTYGTNLLTEMLGESGLFSYPKSLYTVQQAIEAITHASDDSVILDYFAGSGTTAHAVMNMNREDDGVRKYILIEIEEYFSTVLFPRIKKTIYSKEWKEGRPIAYGGTPQNPFSGVSHSLKYLRLESYEDTLNNLVLSREPAQDTALFGANEHEARERGQLREDYMLGYMLDIESRYSPSLLNLELFAHPFNYQLKIARGSAGETQPVAVDLVETFNYLIGLRVETMDFLRGFQVVSGRSPAKERVLIIWRDLEQKSAEDLEEFFRKQDYRPRDAEFDIIFVNGDNHLENIRREDETWKVRLIEAEFLERMFSVEDI